jgi:hypothetical protein
MDNFRQHGVEDESEAHFSRVYDDFVVPAGGWTVLGMFSHNRMDFSGVTAAAWEIRRDMAPGKGGKKVASAGDGLLVRAHQIGAVKRLYTGQS